MMKGLKKSNGMMRSLVKAFTMNFASFIHPCPYIGMHTMMNVKFGDKNHIKMLPTGLYRETTKITDDATKAFVYFDMIYEISNMY